MELAKAYDPKEAEEHNYKRWEESGFFRPEINEDPQAKPYSIVMCGLPVIGRQYETLVTSRGTDARRPACVAAERVLISGGAGG